jgi:hypothetical protein
MQWQPRDSPISSNITDYLARTTSAPAFQILETMPATAPRAARGRTNAAEGVGCADLALSTSPFRKLRIAESEYGLQNFTESGHGFRIYGIEVDMYGIFRGVVFDFFFLGKSLISTLTDSTDSRIPYGFRQKRSATPPRRGRPAPDPCPAPGAYRLAWSRTTAWDRPLVKIPLTTN